MMRMMDEQQANDWTWRYNEWIGSRATQDASERVARSVLPPLSSLYRHMCVGTTHGGLVGLGRARLRLLERKQLRVVVHDAVLGVHHADAEERRDDRRRALAHELWERLRERRRGSLELVVRNDREEVVDLVRPDVVAQVVNERAVRAVDRREVPLDVRPLRVGVPRRLFVVVVLFIVS